MTLGEKIRKARISAGMTQQQLCGDFITRNMLSQIENGIAMPSLQTVQYLAEKLETDIGSLLSDSDLSEQNKKVRLVSGLKKAFSENKTDLCIQKYAESGISDCDEANLIVAECHFRRAVSLYGQGKLKKSLSELKLSREYAKSSIYPSDSIRIKTLLLESKISDILNGSPKIKAEKLPEELSENFFSNSKEERSYTDSFASCCELIEKKQYKKAFSLLSDILKNEKKLTLPFLYLILQKTEICSRELKDFENAYKYSQRAKELYEFMQQ